MNYKGIIDLIKVECLNHYFISQFGYGDISDINTPEDKEPPNYPYMFLNPINVSVGNKISTFNFNLICMTQCIDKETDIITNQSRCIEYLMNILSRVNVSLEEPLVEFVEPYDITPFKERFSDDVVGATASLTIIYPNPLDNCDIPIE